MGNLIPWSQIHPSIKSEEPFVAVVVLDPQRQLCVSEVVELDPEVMGDAQAAAGTLIAAAQAAAVRVAGGYRVRRQAEPAATPEDEPRRLRVLQGGLGKRR
jgi:hypothetical protein